MRKTLLFVGLYAIGAAIAAVIVVMHDSPAAIVLTISAGVVLDDVREWLGEKRAPGKHAEKRRTVEHRACVQRRIHRRACA